MIRSVLFSCIMSGTLLACSPGEPGKVEPAIETEVEAEAQATVTITAFVPEDAGEIYLAGNLDSLGPWEADGVLMEGEGRERTVTLDMPDGYAFEFKITGGTWDQEGTGPSGMVMPNFTHTAGASDSASIMVEIEDFKYPPEAYIEDWEGSGVLGTLVYWLDTESQFFDVTRHVEIWLPPGYEDNPDQRYPVIYMHDGQNLFDPRIANTGHDWGVDEAMMANVEAGLHDSAIVVGIWSTNIRGYELSPWHGGPDYARMVIEEIKPRVDAEFRTLSDRDNTFVMGSSMGGLASQFMVREHPDVFSACGCVSTHVPVSPQVFEEALGLDVEQGIDDPTVPYLVTDSENNVDLPNNIRMYWDWGTATLDAEYGAIMESHIRGWLEAQDFVEGQTYAFGEFEGQPHNEAAWRSRVHLQLAWMLGDVDPATLEQTREY